MSSENKDLSDFGESTTTTGYKNQARKKAPAEQASTSETLSFVFDSGGATIGLFFLGLFGAIGNGSVYPILAYLLSTSFSDISGAAANGLDQIKELAYTFMVFGSFALVMATIQTTCFELVAAKAALDLRLTWFKALLRQDPAFFDVYDIGGIASTVGPSANRYRRGIGRKFGEGIQFFVTGVGGLGYALYANWRVALVVLGVTPLISIAASTVVSLNQTKSTRSTKSYSRAGSVAYSTVSGIKTVLSLNAIPIMVQKYCEATQEAMQDATSVLFKQGFANGSMLGSFLSLYAVLCLYGTYLLYNDVRDDGCDPSAGVLTNETCENSGADVFGAMLGIAFAGQGISQVGNALETFSNSKAAVYEALKAINRKPGADKQIIYHDPEKDDEDASKSSRSYQSADIETPEGKIKAILPKYEIDALSDEGLKPENIQGCLTFDGIKFSYPTRPGQQVLNGFSIDVEAGKTIAFVGPSGGGKSTVVKMLERFYDPLEGSISLDGVNLKDINVKHLRSAIGYVGQEPTLFATSIAQNIQYGNPTATQQQIEEAARLANAHDFISSMPDGYNTQVGDKGTQLSGGQKQRIAIARVLVADPKILLLDEATSALDSESELVVQEALDNVLAVQKRTTVIIAHRLSTIRNADIIAVVQGGVIVETGTHDELMVASTGYYRNLVEKQNSATSRSTSFMSKKSSSALYSGDSVGDLASMADESPGSENGESEIVLDFKDISFSYPTRPNKTILKKFNLSICRGETVALVGPSGGGKSTTVALIERFYDPLEGCLEYRGVDIKALNVKWYRNQIGYVGQEPTLFNETIAGNIAYGAPGASREEIEEAAKQANAYDFIMGFPEGFDTPVGERGAQLSGGQKQRIAIARALVKKPEILLLDEATSALDNESEAVVQEALDKLMESKEQTCIVIAHRLTTIRNADRIAFIGDGHVKEFGSHEELMERPHGRYKRLVESQGRNASVVSLGIVKKDLKTIKDDKEEEEEEEEEPNWKKEIEEEEKGKFNLKRARQLASPDMLYILIGSVGALMAGGVFPMWGLMFGETIELLFRPVFPCDDELLIDLGFDSCQDYWDDVAQWMKERSYQVAINWAIVAFSAIAGNTLTWWGFGNASERMNKRVRDAAFEALVKQEVAYFDKRSVGKVTSQLQDDAARLHTFTGEPIRSFLIAISSVLTGIVLSFVYMWPFALLAMACIPFMGFANKIKMKMFVGEDTGDDSADELNSPGGIVVETLLNMGTVSALTLEDQRYQNFEKAIETSEPNTLQEGFTQGLLAGLSMFIQQWINAIQFFWGGWLLYNHPNLYQFNDFLVSNFALLFSLFGLGTAFQDISDRKETEESASRIFYLLDRQSKIDPTSEEGKKLD